MQTVDEYTTQNIVKRSHPNYDPDELLKDKPFYLLNASYPSFFFTYVHLEPIKVGKGQFIVDTSGNKATLDISVTRSAVYEEIKYEQFQKNETKISSQRFQITGTISSKEGSYIYVSYDGDEAKQIKIDIPETINASTLAINDLITVRGVFTGMTDYRTETGLTKSIPCITAEQIK